ncbi:MAG: hypothetical protein ABFS10_08805 [Bacteroidota bacterium]
MKKESNIPGLQNRSLQQQPFGLPEGYFETFPGRLKERMERPEAKQHPFRRPGSGPGFRLAIAAALIGLALISIPMVRIIGPGNGNADETHDIALLEEAGIFSNDYELAGYFPAEETSLSEEEAYMNQAMAYLATNDVEMDLIFE